MTQKRKAKTNGEDLDQNARPDDGLDMAHEVLSGSDATTLLEQTNLGHGNYDEPYLWQQIRSYRKGLFASVAFSGYLWKTAKRQTVLKLGREGFRYYDESQQRAKTYAPVDESDIPEYRSSWEVELDRGREIWDSLGSWDEALSDKQLAAVLKKANYDGDYLPVFWQMVSGRHEASRSKNAELLRDVMTSVNHLRGQQSEDGGGILQR